MNGLEHALANLTDTTEFQELKNYRPPFNAFTVIGRNSVLPEIYYSNVLFWLLDDSSNSDFLEQFVSFINNDVHALEIRSDRLNYVQREFPDKEKGRLDIYMQFTEAVLAIEVKVNGPLKSEQIQRYQNLLIDKHPELGKAVVSLTVSGYPNLKRQLTDEQPEVPVIDMTWKQISGYIDNCSGQDHGHTFRMQFKDHIDREILVNKKERQLVINFLKKNGNFEVFRKIYENYPRLVDEYYQNKFRRIVANLISEDEVNLDLDKYPSREQHTLFGDQYLRIKVQKWNNVGLPFSLMLYKYRYELPKICVLLQKEDYEKNKETLVCFAEESDGVDCSYRDLSDWWVNWRAVFDSDDFSTGVALTDAEIFDNEFWEQVEQKLEEQLRVLIPSIDEWTNISYSSVNL